ncbi:DUF3088 domain-containing protein [Sphingomonas sp. 37zxx]|uniref:DUF3088 domain-containing protein n=1 Tax=Sphingomonas sp. 37zxx TaxID=1550073 RepID=UPI00053BDA9A|nr:DUF3088 domain-containing protein [Sphingomonas sp. 37zxx]
MKDVLHLMKPGFVNAGLGPFYCGDSVSVEGLLGFYPELRDKIEVIYIDFPRPRQAIVDAIGEDQQSVPVLILAEASIEPEQVHAKVANGSRYIADEKQIREYLSLTHGLPRSG